MGDILTYHVLASEVKSTDLKPFQTVPTVEGKTLDISTTSYDYYSQGKVMVGPKGSKPKNVVAADNLASNGVVHIVDGVMLPPSEFDTSATPNIVELAQSVDDLSTLVTAVVAADLADTLSSPGPFTVFAPTNDGFATLPAGTVESLLKPENKAQLADILTYHVLGSEVKSTDLKFFQRVPTVEGKNLHIFAKGGQVKVGASSKELKNV